MLRRPRSRPAPLTVLLLDPAVQLVKALEHSLLRTTFDLNLRAEAADDHLAEDPQRRLNDITMDPLASARRCLRGDDLAHRRHQAREDGGKHTGRVEEVG